MQSKCIGCGLWARRSIIRHTEYLLSKEHNKYGWSEQIWTRFSESRPDNHRKGFIQQHSYTNKHYFVTITIFMRNTVPNGQLAGLGVSVYDQDDFEAGVIKRLDEEASCRNTQQQRKFAEKEVRDVQIRIR